MRYVPQLEGRTNYHVAQAVRRAFEEGDALERRILGRPTVVAPSAGERADYLLELTLTQPTTEIIAPVLPNPCDRLTVILTQDATGGRQITWSDHFRLATVEILPDEGTVSVFSFIGRTDGRWWLTGLPITGGIA